MAIVITFSSTNGGANFSGPVNFGNTSNGQITSDQAIYIRHNGLNSITGCGLYMDSADPLSYAGDFTAIDDKIEMLSWGDSGADVSFGGYQLNLNATGGFPSISWPSFSAKTTSDTFGINIRSGIGDFSVNLILLPTVTGATSPGTIPAGSTPNVRFKSRVSIPQGVTTVGVRQFKLKLVYNYTS